MQIFERIFESPPTTTLLLIHILSSTKSHFALALPFHFVDLNISHAPGMLFGSGTRLGAA